MGLLNERIEGVNRASVPVERDYTREFFDSLPFEPTNAQKRAVAEAVTDMQGTKQMNRLLQGDVGSKNRRCGGNNVQRGEKRFSERFNGTHGSSGKSAL